MGKEDNTMLCAVLSYLLVGIIWYFIDERMRKSDFVKFHTRQAVALLILAIIVSVVNMLFGFIPIMGWLISVILSIGLLILWLIGIIGALQGKRREVPVVGQFAKSFAF